VSASPLQQLPNTYRTFYGAFPALRPFQIEVITPLLQGHDLILQAATGSGKTEAVLAPCLERVRACSMLPSQGVRHTSRSGTHLEVGNHGTKNAQAAPLLTAIGYRGLLFHGGHP
jgi:hypothetical protein